MVFVCQTDQVVCGLNERRIRCPLPPSPVLYARILQYTTPTTDRSGVYCHTDAQHTLAMASLGPVQATIGPGIDIATEIIPAEVFWPAEAEHQDYLRKGGRFSTPQSATKGCTDEIRCYG